MPSRATQRNGRRDRRGRSILSPRDFALVKSAPVAPAIADAAIIKTPPFAFSKLSRSTGEGLLLDTQGRCRYVSASVADQLGTTRAGLMLDGWKKYLTDESMQMIRASRNSGIECAFMRFVRLQPEDGEPLLLSFRPAWHRDGSLAGYLGLVKKIALARSQPETRAV